MKRISRSRPRATHGRRPPRPTRRRPAARGQPAGWSRKNPYPARILRSVNLNGPGSEKRTHHVEIDLGDGGLAYEVGDALGVYPDELPGAGRRAARRPRRLGRRAGRACLGGEVRDLREALARHALPGRGRPTPARGARRRRPPTPAEAAALRACSTTTARSPAVDVLDLLRRVPLGPAGRGRVRSPRWPRIRPRLYSISSSPRRHAGQVHLTVGRVAYDRRRPAPQGGRLDHAGRPARARRRGPRLRPEVARVPPPRPTRRADHHDRPRHRHRPVPRLPPGARRRRRRPARTGCSSATSGPRHRLPLRGRAGSDLRPAAC